MHYFRRLLDSQSPEEPQLNDAALIRIDLCQPIKNIVKCQEVCVGLLAESADIFQ